MFLRLKSSIKNIANNFLPYEFNLFLKKKKRERKRKKLRFSVHLVDHCNLNCKCCDNFSCIADEKYHDITSIENDFRRICELAKGKLQLIRLSGGEPLLHPKLLNILDITYKYFPKTDIELVTNGILLQKQTDDFWLSLKKNNIKLMITRYPLPPPNKLPYKKIEQSAKHFNVLLKYNDDTAIKQKTMHKMPLDLAGSQNPQESFYLCYKANTCIMLDDGKIYTCATIPYIKYFNKQFKTDIKTCDKDYIDIYKVNNIDEIFDFLCKPMPFCRYCNTKEPKYGIDWSVSNKNISEWI